MVGANFIWKILAEEDLLERKEIIVDWPCLCKMGGETVDYLLLHCFFAQDLYLG
jgi:hypothetical protein